MIDPREGGVRLGELSPKSILVVGSSLLFTPKIRKLVPKTSDDTIFSVYIIANGRNILDSLVISYSHPKVVHPFHVVLLRQVNGTKGEITSGDDWELS